MTWNREPRPPGHSALHGPVANPERMERVLGVLLWIALLALLIGMSR